MKKVDVTMTVADADWSAMLLWRKREIRLSPRATEVLYAFFPNSTEIRICTHKFRGALKVRKMRRVWSPYIVGRSRSFYLCHSEMYRLFGGYPSHFYIGRI